MMGKISVARKYDRLAAIFDLLENPMEMMGGKKWRKRLFAQVEGDKILEVGVGTGKNFPYYPPHKSVTGIDISKKMLAKAAWKAAQLKLSIPLYNMDVQDLKFPPGSFDAVVSTFVFCSVADPEKGLEEIKRVLKPGGKIFFLEHVRPRGIRGRIFDLLNPFFVRLLGNNINRPTLAAIRKAGFTITHEENLFSDIFKFIESARP